MKKLKILTLFLIILSLELVSKEGQGQFCGRCGPNLVNDGNFDATPCPPGNYGIDPRISLICSGPFNIPNAGDNDVVIVRADQTNSIWVGAPLAGANFMYGTVGDGAPIDPNDFTIWSQAVTVQEGVEYVFSAWVMDIREPTNPQPASPTITLSIVSGATTLASAFHTPSPNPSNWEQVCTTPWTCPTGMTTINLIISVPDTIYVGFDFGLDVIAFGSTALDVSAIATNPTDCESEDGVIIVTAVGRELEEGEPPPVYSYSIDGGVTTQGSNIFSGLGRGSYIITVIDQNGCSGEVSQELFGPEDCCDPWCILGNTDAIDPGTTGSGTGQHFWGTQNDFDVVAGTNNLERMRITSGDAQTGGLVGIATPTPECRLHLNDGAVLFDGGDDILPNIIGAGTRLMWMPGRTGAFRAGIVTGNQWDPNNIGGHSFACGYDNIAFGSASVSMGQGNNASGVGSICLGSTNSAEGIASLAAGEQCNVTLNSGQATGAIALGYGAQANGTASVAIGINTFAAQGGVAFATHTPTAGALGTNSFAAGYDATATGENAVAIGRYNHASGFASLALGTGSVASDRESVAIGVNNTSGSEESFTFGTGNVTNAPAGQLYAMAIGMGCTASDNHSIALGQQVTNAVPNSLMVDFGVAGFGGEPSLFVGATAVGIGTSAPTWHLSVNGDAGKPGGGTWQVFSDRNLKKDIKSFNHGLDIISKINPIFFKYNGKAGITDTETEYVGVIAQELQKVAPFMVSSVQHENRDGSSEEILCVDPNAFLYLTINSIQEQQVIIETQNSRIDELEAKIDNLIASLENVGVSSTAGETNASLPVNLQNTISDDGNGNILLQNEPNPFSRSTKITYQISGQGNVDLRVYSYTGIEVASLVNSFQQAGIYSVDWLTESLPAGIYIYVLKLDNGELIRQAIHIE